MEEEIVIEQEYIDAAKAEILKNPKLQPCPLCMHYDEEKKWCKYTKKARQSYHYGSACFITNEIKLKALLLQERKRSIQRKAVLQRKMDIMEALINAADLVRDDIQDMIETDYARLDIKAKTDDAVYQKSKKNMDRLQKAYSRMKVACQNIESDYRNYCEYWHQFMFADERGVFSREYDKYKSNAGFLAYSFFLMDDAMFESEANVSTFIDFLNGLPRKRKSPMEESDLKKYLIKV